MLQLPWQEKGSDRVERYEGHLLWAHMSGVVTGAEQLVPLVEVHFDHVGD